MAQFLRSRLQLNAMPFLFALVLAVSLLAVGCSPKPQGPQVYRVEGKVEFTDGRPVRTGKVELLSEDGEWSATGTIEADGTFVLGTHDSDDGAIEGKHSLIVKQFFIPGHPTMSLETAGPAVADKYNSFSTTPLTMRQN